MENVTSEEFASFAINLNGKRILLGISGGIAAYKTPELVRLLKKLGAEVQVVLTNGGKQFVSELALHTVSERPVFEETFKDAEMAMRHIELARWADIILIAPLSANRMAALAHGMADDLLTNLCLASKAPLFIAPAMNEKMWHHVATQVNLELLKERGATVLGPAEGAQACGDVGVGRMVEPETIALMLTNWYKEQQNFDTSFFAGKKILVTAGPTREPIDPVRYLGNYSSGKMGYAIAERAQQLGAEVLLVSGPVDLAVPCGVKCVKVNTALEMSAAVLENIQGIDIFISSAAVADYRIAQVAPEKIKKHHASLQLNLVKNPDILAMVAEQSQKPFCVGFAAETENLEENAKQKLISKGIDMLALNDVSQKNIGFGVDTNALTVYWHGGQKTIDLASKSIVAFELLQLIRERYAKN